MININIIFENDFDDVDIIAIPDEIASKIEIIGQEFLNWVPNANDENYWTIIDGKRCSVAETDGFIKWLNSKYCTDFLKSYVVKTHTKYCPQFQSIEF